MAVFKTFAIRLELSNHLLRERDVLTGEVKAFAHSS